MLFLTLLFLLLPKLAYCYLDPGTGTALINIIIAGAVTIIYGMKGLFLRIMRKDKNSEYNLKQNTHITISIFSEGKQYWNSYRAIITELISGKVLFNYYTSDIDDPALLIESKYMNSRFLGYGFVQKARFFAIKGDVLLTTTPNIGAKGYLPRPKNIKKMIHFFHSVCDISMYRKQSLDFYDGVYLAGKFQKKSIREIERKRNSKTKDLTIVGLPYLDDLLSRKESFEKESNVKTVLIGSSWGDKGLLNYYGIDFIKDIAAMDIDIIIRPHPQSLKSEIKMISNLKKELKRYSNVNWDLSIDPTDSMLASDLLISDTSSLRFDYAFIYEKPVITLEIPQEAMPDFERDDMVSIWSDEVSNDIGYVLDLDKVGKIRKYIGMINNEFGHKQLNKLRDTTIMNFGSSAKAYVKQLVSEVGEN